MIGRYVTLGEIVRQFNPGCFVDGAWNLALVWGACFAYTSSGQENTMIDPHSRAQWLPVAETAVEDCRAFDLKASQVCGQRIVVILRDPRSTWGQLRQEVRDMTSRLTDEMEASVFYRVDFDKQPLLTEPEPFGEAVAIAFPTVKFDIEEAGRCLAFGRWTASAFHCMRVLESGLTVLATDLKVKTEQSNWQPILIDIEKAISRIGPELGSDWRDKRQFYSEAALQFRYFKDAWRNHVMHVKQYSYDADRATETYSHVKGFMRHIATKVAERKA